MTGKLILLRHGESEWNAKNLFTGWVDVDINEKGEAEARKAAELLASEGLLPTVLHTSLLRRAIHTAYLALDGCDRHWIPVRRSWRLNERHYGALQGLDKTATRDKYGDEQFMLWRRSYDTPPPVQDTDAEYSQFNDPRYADIPANERPRTECLKDVVARMLPYWEESIVQHLDTISDEDIAGLNIPTGIPLLYELDENHRPLVAGGRYLDPEAAAASIEAVKNQGKK